MTRSFFSEWSGNLGPAPGEASFVHDANMEQYTMNWPLFIGLLVTFLGLAMTAIGLMLQKYALNVQNNQKEEDRKPYFLMKWWIIGMTVFCIGNLTFWAVLALVPQVVLACWQCWAMIITILLAPVILGEMVTMGKLISVLIIIAGVVWVVMASPHEYEEYTSEQFWKAVHDYTFLSITAGMILLFLLLIASQYWHLEQRMSAIRYVLIAAIINWYSVLSARCSSGFFLTTILHDNHHIGLEFGLLFALMLSCAALNVHFLNRALQEDKAIFVVPVYESLAISGQILFGIVFFREFDGLSIYETLNISFAVAVVIGGVILSSMQEPDTPFLKQIVISEELCGCCFCFRNMDPDADEQPLLCASRDPEADAVAETEKTEALPERGYKRKQVSGPRGDGGPRGPGGPRGGNGGNRPEGRNGTTVDVGLSP